MNNDFFRISNMQEFFSSYWGKAYTKIPNALKLKKSGKDIIKELLRDPFVEYPTLRIYDDGKLRNPFDYTKSSRRSLSPVIDPEKVINGLSDPGTIKIENVDLYVKKFEELKKSIHDFFDQTPITANMYHSVGPVAGIPAHYDPYHIFVCQVAGEKTWNLGKKIVANPHKDFFVKNFDEGPELSDSVVTEPGDILYIPPGLAHRAYTEKSSTHIAIGIHTQRFYEAVQEKLFDCAADIPELRADIGFSFTDGSMRKNQIDQDQLTSILKIIEQYVENEQHS